MFKPNPEVDYQEVNTLLYATDELHDFGNDTDPENYFLQHINNGCQFYKVDQFHNTLATENRKSIINFTGRSLYANFHKIKDCLNQITNPFNIFLISKTWLNSDQGGDY